MVDRVTGGSQLATIGRYKISVGSWLTVNFTWWGWDSFLLWHMQLTWRKLKITSPRNTKGLSPTSIMMGIQYASRPFASYTPSGILASRRMALFQGNVAMSSNVMLCICLTSSLWEHAILLPWRIPGYKRDDVKFLPSSTTKKAASTIQLLRVSLMWEYLDTPHFVVSGNNSCPKSS